VAIDERSLKELGPWPWDRSVLAEIVARAAESKAKAVVLDILLAEPRSGDDQLAREMKRIPTIAVSVLVEREQCRRARQFRARSRRHPAPLRVD
jgi:adenylate cyclase